MNYIELYWELIQSGEIVVCKKIRKQYKKLYMDIINPDSKYIFNEKKANKAIQFVEQFCKQSKGEWIGKPMELMLFQKAAIAAIFGFYYREDTKKRRFKEVFFLLARKNGKSTLLSAISIYMLMADKEGGAEVYSVATKKDQARIVFSEAVNMVKQSPALNKHITKRKTDLYFPLTYSKMEALSSDSNSLDGLNSHCVVIDELHAIKDRNLYEVMKQSMAARRNPLLCMITTAGLVRDCIFDDMYDYACRVAEGIVEDERFLPILYELDERSEWTNPQMWIKANPSLGTIKKLSDIEEKVERAKVNQKDLPGILCKDFNVRETRSGSWLNLEEIINKETFDMEDLRDCYAIGGVDLSSTTDLTCASLMIMKKGSDKKYLIQQYFLPRDIIEKRAKEDKVPYDIWSKNGLLTPSGDEKIDYRDVTNWFIKMFQTWGIRPLWIYYDPWNSQYWVKHMDENGFEMREARQGYKTLSQPMKILEADLKKGVINYNFNSILIMCLTNTVVKRDENDNIRPVKGQNQRARIDGTIALLLCYVGLCENLSNYENML